MSVDDRGGPQPGERKRRRVTPGSVAAALFGAALFALTLRQTRLDEVVAGMQSVGWGFLVIILLSGLRLFVRAWAWTLCTPADAGLRVTAPRRATVGRNDRSASGGPTRRPRPGLLACGQDAA